MKSKKVNLAKLLYEFLSISVAVLIALFVNQGREDYNHKKLAEKAIVNIKEELKENKEQMEEFVPYHKSILAATDSLITRIEAKNEITGPIEDINVTLISSSAWEMAKITNAMFYIEFDEVNNLAKVYNLQSYYESIVKQYVLDITGQFSENTDLQNLRSQKRFLETIVPMEEDLKYYYELMLANLASTN